jgi:lipopolysaccharide export system protein LptC
MQECMNAKVQRLWTGKGALLLLVLAAGLAMGCRPDKPRETGEVVPELKLEGVRFRVYREASLRASGQAATATYRRDNQGLQATRLDTVLTTDTGEKVRVTAPEGRGDLGLGTFGASGGLVVFRREDVVRTDRAWYVPTPDRGEGLVSGDQPVLVESKDYRLHGNSFTYDPATGQIDLLDGAWFVSEGTPEATR